MDSLEHRMLGMGGLDFGSLAGLRGTPVELRLDSEPRLLALVLALALSPSQLDDMSTSQHDNPGKMTLHFLEEVEHAEICFGLVSLETPMRTYIIWPTLRGY